MANSRSGESVLDRVMRVLDVVADRDGLTPTQLADAAGLPRTSGYRLISDLTSRGLLHRTDTGTVEPGHRLWELGQRTGLSRTLRHTALPFMQDVNAVVQQTTQLSILSPEGVLIVERLSRHGAVTNPAEVAGIMPAHHTSMGHVLLAFGSADRTQEWLTTHWETVAAERPTLRDELAQTRDRGFARLNGLIDPETTGVTVPVLNRRRQAEAALTAVVPRDSPAIPQVLMALQTAGHGIARALQ
jgi:DNA-binding IclR family transcriptional regulator